MKFSSAAILGLASCALAMPTRVAERSEVEKRGLFSIPSGLPGLGDLPKPSGLPDLKNLFGGGSEKRSFPPTPSELPTPSGLPVPSGTPSLEPSPRPSSGFPSFGDFFGGGFEKRDILPAASDIPGLDGLKDLFGGLTGSEKRGLFPEAPQFPKPSGAPSFGDKPGIPGFPGFPAPSGLPVPAQPGFGGPTPTSAGPTPTASAVPFSA